MAIPAAAAAAGGSSAGGAAAGSAAASSGMSAQGAAITSAAIQGGSSLIGDLFGAFIIKAVQTRRAMEKADEWNAKLLDREDQQNRFSNMVTMRGLDQNQQQINESKKMNNTSLYQNQFEKMLSTVNANANLKNLVTQRWGGK